MDNSETQLYSGSLTAASLHRWLDLYRSLFFALSACCTLVVLSFVAQPLFNPLYLVQIGLPGIAVWFSTGVILDDRALEMLLATQTPMRRLWIRRAAPVVGVAGLISVVWLLYLEQPGIIVYTVSLIIGASGWAQALTYWQASSLVGKIGVASILLSQYIMPVLWLPEAQVYQSDYVGFIKSLFFFPLDADPMFAVLHPQRPLNALVIGGLGCIGWIWCFTRYNNLEHILTADHF